MASSEDDRALHIWGPRLVLDRFVAKDREAYLVAPLQGIDLMPCPCAMKDDLIALSVIKEVDRNGIGITVITINSQNTTAGTTKQRFCERLP